MHQLFTSFDSIKKRNNLAFLLPHCTKAEKTQLECKASELMNVINTQNRTTLVMSMYKWNHSANEETVVTTKSCMTSFCHLDQNYENWTGTKYLYWSLHLCIFLKFVSSKVQVNFTAPLRALASVPLPNMYLLRLLETRSDTRKKWYNTMTEILSSACSDGNNVLCISILRAQI